jgi:predicted permease
MIADRIYRFLLHAYPGEFRDEYSRDLVQLFRDNLRDSGVLGTWLLALNDLIRTAPAQHFDILRRDLKSAIRYFAAHPGFALVAILSLALGLGANTAIFSLLNATLYNDLPVRDPHQLVSIARGGLGDAPPFSYPDYLDLRAGATSFSDLIFHSDVYTLKFGRGAETEAAGSEFVSPNYFETLGVSAALGRTFVTSDAREPVVILSDALWRRRFAADPSVLGRQIRVNGADLTVIGIAPASFHGVLVPWSTAAWLPIELLPRLVEEDAAVLTSRFSDCCGVIGRLKPGVSRAQAQAEIAVLGRQLAAANPRPRADRRERGWGELHLASMQGVVPQFVRARMAMLLAILMTIATLVLLIACANVANLLLARVAERRAEIGIRLAIGARRGRLIRQLLTECALLTFIAAIATLFLATQGPRAIAAFSPYVIDAHLDLKVFGFAALGAILTTLAFGLAPALEASRTDLVSALKENRRTGARAGRFGFTSALVVAQVAASFALLTGAGLAARSFWTLSGAYPGFDPSHAFLLRFDLGSKHWNAAQQGVFLDNLLGRVDGIAGVRSESLTTHAPLEIVAQSAPLELEDDAGQVWLDAVRSRYFETLSIPMIAGRPIEDRDRANSALVAVVNTTLARRIWEGENPVGQEIRLGGATRTVVGVVATVKHRFASEEPAPVAYIPLSQAPATDLRLVVRTLADPSNVIAPVLAEFQSLDPDIPVVQVQTMAEHTAASLGPQRSTAGLISLFAILSLALASVGIFGVIAHSVSRRTHEIGIRMAMGAHRRDVVRMVVGQSLTLATIGIAIGALVALGAARFLKGLLYGIGPADPFTFVTIALVWFAVAALAAWLPALRAARVDPLIALRCE